MQGVVAGRAAPAFCRQIRRNRLHGALRPPPITTPSHKHRQGGARYAGSPKEWWAPEARVRDLYTDCTGPDVVQLQQLLHLEGYMHAAHVNGWERPHLVLRRRAGADPRSTPRSGYRYWPDSRRVHASDGRGHPYQTVPLNPAPLSQVLRAHHRHGSAPVASHPRATGDGLLGTDVSPGASLRCAQPLGLARATAGWFSAAG